MVKTHTDFKTFDGDIVYDRIFYIGSQVVDIIIRYAMNAQSYAVRAEVKRIGFIAIETIYNRDVVVCGVVSNAGDAPTTNQGQITYFYVIVGIYAVGIKFKQVHAIMSKIATNGELIKADGITITIENSIAFQGKSGIGNIFCSAFILCGTEVIGCSQEDVGDEVDGDVAALVCIRQKVCNAVGVETIVDIDGYFEGFFIHRCINATQRRVGGHGNVHFTIHFEGNVAVFIHRSDIITAEIATNKCVT